jgi:hypothetical protein
MYRMAPTAQTWWMANDVNTRECCGSPMNVIRGTSRNGRSQIVHQCRWCAALHVEVTIELPGQRTQSVTMTTPPREWANVSGAHGSIGG